MHEPKLREQIDSIRRVLDDTRKAELEWTVVGEGPVFQAVRQGYLSLLERDDEDRITLRFMTDAGPEWAVVLRQFGAEAIVGRDEDTRDGLLSRLWQIVEHKVEPPNPMTGFVQAPPVR